MVVRDEKSYIPAYIQLKKQLLRRIGDGEYGDDGKLPSLRVLQKRTGLNYKTVAHAVSELIDEGFLISKHGSGTYVAPKLNNTTTVSRELRLAIVGNPNLAFPLISTITPFTYEIMQGINDKVSANGHALVPLLDQKTPIYDTLQSARAIDAVIILNADSNAEVVQKMVDWDVPYVAINKPYNGFDGNYVGATDCEGMFALTEYLINKGHREFLYLNHTQSVYTFAERWRGFKRAIIKHHLDLEKQCQILTSLDISSGYAEIEKYLSDNKCPSAVISATDPVAYGAMQAIREKGLSVPDDVAVAGFMDLELLRNLHVGVTTVKMPIKEMGRTAVGIIESLLLDKKKGPIQVELKTELVVRNTT